MFLWRQGTDLKQRAEWLASLTFVVLAIQIPKRNDKGPASIEQFFASLHGIYRDDPQIQEFISLEIVAARESIIFYIFTPIHLREFVEGQLYAQYPDLEIRQVPDYAAQVDLDGLTVATADILLNKDEVYPIKTYPNIDIDPLAGITAVMANLEEKEHIWFQTIVQPVGDEWQDKGTSYVKAIREGKDPNKKGSSGGPVLQAVTKTGRLLIRVAKEASQPGTGLEDGSKKSDEAPKLTAPQEAAMKGIEAKTQKLGFETLLRLTVISSTETMARARIQAMLAALKQFNTTHLNGFTAGQIKINDFPSWQKYVSRECEEKGKILNIEELASLYHFPTSEVETSAISWSGAKKGEAPFNVPLKNEVDPEELTVLGLTDFRNQAEEFGIKLNDRKRHIYIIGKSGVGKSTLLENMIIDDVLENRGIIVVDPHGETADKIVECIPDHRIGDVIFVDPSDREHPVAFNPLESISEDFKGTVASGFVGIFKKIFGNSWGPRLEHILRNTVLALLDTENPTMLGIPRMLTEAGYRAQVIPQIKDVVVRDFWVHEFNGWSDQQRNEAVAPVLNKVGQFLSSSMIRNIVGQPRSTFDIRKVMDERKILIVNLSKGKIGEDNMALLGAMIITKVQLAAMSRADVPAAQRPDSFLYVDEFQNFATESFATILSEARKYGLGLTIAHQYIAQLTDEVRDAVIGNAGTLISFRVGAPDAEVMSKEFAPVFGAEDIVNLQMARIYIKLLIDGIAAPAFSAQTLPPRVVNYNNRQAVVESSRSHYALTKEQAETIIDEVAGYKQRREAEEASKKASELLQQAPPPARPNAAYSNNNQPAEKRTIPDRAFSTPVQQVQKPEPAPQAQSLPTSEVNQEEANSEQKPKKPQIEKPLKVMSGISYKEVAQRGGQKWFLGEPEDVAVARREARKLAEQGSGAEDHEVKAQQGSAPVPLAPKPSQETVLVTMEDHQTLPAIRVEPEVPSLTVSRQAPEVVENFPQPLPAKTEHSPNSVFTTAPKQGTVRNDMTKSVNDSGELTLREGDELSL
jgi:hypothetical protein